MMCRDAIGKRYVTGTSMKTWGQQDGSHQHQWYCKHCVYFGERGPLGYCRCHEMYVLRDFDCSKFVLRPGCVPAEDADVQIMEKD